MKWKKKRKHKDYWWQKSQDWKRRRDGKIETFRSKASRTARQTDSPWDFKSGSTTLSPPQRGNVFPLRKVSVLRTEAHSPPTARPSRGSGSSLSLVHNGGITEAESWSHEEMGHGIFCCFMAETWMIRQAWHWDRQERNRYIYIKGVKLQRVREGEVGKWWKAEGGLSGWW